jgi:ketosteroid isomerase-like protein
MSLKDHLDAYRRAFNSRSPEDALALFADHALFELPLLGQRLFGKPEIAAGLRRIFAVTETAQFSFTDLTESDRLLIAEGRLEAKLHRDAGPVAMTAAITLEATDGKIARLSTYLDARPYRLWSDGPIFAAVQS